MINRHWRSLTFNKETDPIGALGRTAGTDFDIQHRHQNGSRMSTGFQRHSASTRAIRSDRPIAKRTRFVANVPLRLRPSNGISHFSVGLPCSASLTDGEASDPKPMDWNPARR
jgi:hypothetical protein